MSHMYESNSKVPFWKFQKIAFRGISIETAFLKIFFFIFFLIFEKY